MMYVVKSIGIWWLRLNERPSNWHNPKRYWGRVAMATAIGVIYYAIRVWRGIY